VRQGRRFEDCRFDAPGLDCRLLSRWRTPDARQSSLMASPGSVVGKPDSGLASPTIMLGVASASYALSSPTGSFSHGHAHHLRRCRPAHRSRMLTRDPRGHARRVGDGSTNALVQVSLARDASTTAMTANVTRFPRSICPMRWSVGIRIRHYPRRRAKATCPPIAGFAPAAASGPHAKKAFAMRLFCGPCQPRLIALLAGRINSQSAKERLARRKCALDEGRPILALNFRKHQAM